MRVSPLRCWALLAAIAAAGALAQSVPPSTTLTNAVPLPAAKPGAIRSPGTAPNGVPAKGTAPNGVPEKGKAPNEVPGIGTAPDGVLAPDELPPPPERPLGWLPRTTPQEGPELNAVPLSRVEGGEMRRVPRELEPTPVLDALGNVIDVTSFMHRLPAVTDMLTGNHYMDSLGVAGKILKAADISLKIGRGYYRDEGDGAAAAIEDLWVSAKTKVIIDVSAGVATGLAGLGTAAAAPVAAAASAGYAAGSVVDKYYGDRIFENNFGKRQESDYKEYDRTVLEPQRQEMGRQLREKHQRTKAENATRATVAAQRAEADRQAQVKPAIAESTGPSGVQLILQSVIQVQQARIEAKAAAQGGGASPQVEPRKACSPVCTVQ